MERHNDGAIVRTDRARKPLCRAALSAKCRLSIIHVADEDDFTRRFALATQYFIASRDV